MFDMFVFAPGSGFDKIKDFEDGIDQLDLSAFGFSDFALDVLAKAVDRPAGLRLDLGAGDVVFLDLFSNADFDASDVMLG